VNSVVAQLLSVKAGDTISGRVVDACGGTITTDAILAMSHDELRATGVSNAKAITIRGLAEHLVGGTLELTKHGRMSDADVERELVAVHGIGEWTAHMYLMFTLGRPDVWPVGDLGVRDGWSLIHGIDPMIAARDLRAEGTRFAGMRSAVAWYCWQIRHL
jgi:DNA-3-methyladenine glycosylase II